MADVTETQETTTEPEAQGLTTEQLNDLWLSEKPTRDDMSLRMDYYEGNQKILHTDTEGSTSDTYADGKKKSKIIMNWMELGVDEYVGALTSKPWQITLKDTDDDEEGNAVDQSGLEAYRELSEQQAINIINSETLKNSLILGFALEVHSYDGENIQITTQDPREWAIIRDSATGEISVAIRRYKLPENSIFNGVMLTKPVEMQVVYTADTITTYMADTATDQETAALAWQIQGDPVKHPYGQVPIVQWALNTDMRTIISDALISQQDEYNSIDSASGDDIRAFVDAIMICIGQDPEWVRENSALIRDQRMLPFNEGGDAKYLTRPQDIAPIVARLQRTRSHIHMMLKIPDTEEITGATGDTSGIALQLRYMLMIHEASAMTLYLEQGVRRRIDLINIINAKRSEPQLVDYKITIDFTLPVNRLEEWDKIGNLNEIISHLTQLELLTDVPDPNAEMERIQAEKGAALAVDTPVQDGEVAAAAQDVRTAAGAAELQPAISEIVDMIAAGALQQLRRSGAIDTIVARDRRAREAEEQA
jgi:SPP1 family phage portal protein